MKWYLQPAVEGLRFDVVPDEVPLDGAPLVRVIVQARVSRSPELTTEQAVTNVRRAVKQYPVIRQERMFGFVLEVDGIMAKPDAGELVWRLVSSDDRSTISLASDFVALEVTSYPGRTGFLGEWRRLLEAVEPLFEFRPEVQRVGIRFVNQLGSEQQRFVDQLNPVLRATAGDSLSGGELIESVTQLGFQVGQGKLAVRWARVPPGATVDPAVPVREDLSWVLDLDAASSPGSSFTVDSVVDATQWGAETAYTFFRWAVPDAALEALL